MADDAHLLTPKSRAAELSDRVAPLGNRRASSHEEAPTDGARRGSLYASASRARRQTLIVHDVLASPSGSPARSGMRTLGAGAVFGRAHKAVVDTARRKNSLTSLPSPVAEQRTIAGVYSGPDPLEGMEAVPRQTISQMMDSLHPLWLTQSKGLSTLFKTITDRITALEDVVLVLKDENAELKEELRDLSSHLAGDKPEDEVTSIFQDKLRVALAEYRTEGQRNATMSLKHKLASAAKSKHAALLFAHAKNALKVCSDLHLREDGAELRSVTDWATDSRKELDALRDKLRAAANKPAEKAAAQTAFTEAEGRFHEAETELKKAVVRAERSITRVRCRPSLQTMWRIAARYGRTLARLKIIARNSTPQLSVVERLQSLEQVVPRIRQQEEYQSVLHNELTQVQQANMQVAGVVQDIEEKAAESDKQQQTMATTMGNLKENVHDMRMTLDGLGDVVALTNEVREKADKTALETGLGQLRQRVHAVELSARHSAPMAAALEVQEQALHSMQSNVTMLSSNLRHASSRIDKMVNRIPREGTMHNLKMSLSKKLEKKDVLRLLGGAQGISALMDASAAAGEGDEGASAPGAAAVDQGALLKCLSCNRALRPTPLTHVLDISGGGQGVTTLAPGGWFDRGEQIRPRPRSASPPRHYLDENGEHLLDPDLTSVGGGGGNTDEYFSGGVLHRVSAQVPSPKGRPASAPAARGRKKNRKGGRKGKRGSSRSSSRSGSPTPSPANRPRPVIPNLPLVALTTGSSPGSPGSTTSQTSEEEYDTEMKAAEIKEATDALARRLAAVGSRT